MKRQQSSGNAELRKNPVGHHFLYVIKKENMDDNKEWLGGRKIGTLLICLWEGLEIALCHAVLGPLEELKMKVLCDITIPV